MCIGRFEAEDMGEDNLGVFSGLEGKKPNAFGEFEKDVFLDYTGDQLVNLFGAAVDF